MKHEICFYVNNLDPRISAAVEYIFDHFGRDYDVVFQKVHSVKETDITIGEGLEADFTLASRLFKEYNEGGVNAQNLFKIINGLPVLAREKRPDYILSAFVLLSGMQEWLSKKKDKWGRFPYCESFQEKFGQARVAWVDKYFEKIYQKLKTKFKLPLRKEKRSHIALTHDIDLLRWPLLQNSSYYFSTCLTSGSKQAIQSLPLLFSNTRKNIDAIVELEHQFGVQSIFFWLTETGRGAFNIKNADYSLNSKYVQNAMKNIEGCNSVNALHKSSKSKPIIDELDGNCKLCPISRFHFLLFNLPSHGNEIDQSVQQDYSYGFAEQMGFRNSYSRPFHPFDFRKWKAFSFLEVPLNIMDNTLLTYLKKKPEEAEEEIFDFLNNHKSGSCISILWHNEYFTTFKYSKWRELYKRILKYLFKENAFTSVLPKDIEVNYRIY